MKYEILEPIALSDEEDAKVDRMIAEAEKGLKEVNVNFRWTKDKVDLIKQAAVDMGMPYQTYLKSVVLRQALQDIQAVQEAVTVQRQKQTVQVSASQKQISRAKKEKTSAKAQANADQKQTGRSKKARASAKS